MKYLTSNDIKIIHDNLEEIFPLMLKGIAKEGLIQSAINKQSSSLFGSPQQYDTVYEKAAVLMESITRWHIFNDGNKRTGLLSTFLYLHINDYKFVMPDNTDVFMYKIASNTSSNQEEIEDLIKEITQWLKKHTNHNKSK